HAFGVQQRSVHVEDHGLERLEAQYVGLGFHPVRYRSICFNPLGRVAIGWVALANWTGCASVSRPCPASNHPAITSCWATPSSIASSRPISPKPSCATATSAGQGVS